MTTAEEYGTALEPVEVVDAELVEDDSPGADEVAVHDPVAAVLAALDTKAAEDLHESRPHKTKTGNARDWELWGEFHDWLAEQTGTRLPDSAITVGTYVAFVKWLDEVKEAAPNSIERPRHRGRVRGSQARLRGAQGRPYGRHPGTQAAQAGQGAAGPRPRQGRRDHPADLREMNTTPLERAPQERARRRQVHVVPEPARLRDRSLHTMRFAIAGRNEEMSELDDTGIRLVAEGLEVHVPSVKGHPPRDVVVSYGESADTCAVRCWIAWQEAKLAAGAAPGGPAYLPSPSGARSVRSGCRRTAAAGRCPARRSMRG
ncbi:hypothetical protein ACFRCI_49405 [Streptomyces sp. NPDC056638]|uniref:hypothetical protein n=1 Tax=Streptomyces sp. NPDC056638 TaxID=3345887 RepID=UPI0036B10463